MQRLSVIARHAAPRALAVRALAASASPAHPLATIIYTSPAVTSTGGRAGSLKSADGSLNLTLTLPKALGGTSDDKQGLNPETLFAGGYAACFKGAMGVAAGMQTPPVKLTDKTTIVGTCQIGKSAAGKLCVAVQLDITCPDADKVTAQKIVDSAHQICPYSNGACMKNMPFCHQ